MKVKEALSFSLPHSRRGLFSVGVPFGHLLKGRHGGLPPRWFSVLCGIHTVCKLFFYTTLTTNKAGNLTPSVFSIWFKTRGKVWLIGTFETPKHHNIDTDQFLVNEFGHKFHMYIYHIHAYIHLPVCSSLLYLKMDCNQPWARKLEIWNFGDLMWNGFCNIHCELPTQYLFYVCTY